MLKFCCLGDSYHMMTNMTKDHPRELLMLHCRRMQIRWILGVGVGSEAIDLFNIANNYQFCKIWGIGYFRVFL